LNDYAQNIQGTPEDVLQQLTAEAQAIAQMELQPEAAQSLEVHNEGTG